MDEIHVPRRQLTDPIVFGTGQPQLIIVQRPCVHALDIEDTHFAHDRSILMPDLARVDGTAPTLDDRRITGLGVVYAALQHAEAHPEQKILVVGHTDRSGPKTYNQQLSEKRARNVLLFLRGDRDGWRADCDAEAHPDDIQRVLKFQAARAGWDCDPGPLTGRLGRATKQAIGRFQERFNEEVQRVANEGIDLPYKTELGVDEDAGPKTWGGFFDIYAHELMRLLGLEAHADLDAKLGALQGFDALPASVGCGEHIPFAAGRRRAFEPDDARDRPRRNPSDRRVEILFFDAAEEPDLACHAGDGCDPSACPLYTTDAYCHYEIGVPRGLQIGEVVLELRFADPQGNTHLLPAGIEVEVRFDDGSSITQILTESGRVSFVAARDKSSFDLALTTEDGDCVVLLPGSDGSPATTELLGRDEALEKVDEGGRFFRLPDAFDTHDCEWGVPPDVAFSDGRFVELDLPATQIGTRAEPAHVILEPTWQHFRFDYFDRWRSQATSVPQPRPRQPDTPPLVLEGHVDHVDYETGPTDVAAAESVWDVAAADHTLHCLAWIQRRTPDNGRTLPDAECLTRFVLPAATFVRTDGAPDDLEATRTIEAIGGGHEHHAEAHEPNAQRLRYYDLPEQWWSRGYRVRRGSEALGLARLFADITEASSSRDPYVVDLDQIVVCGEHETMNPFAPTAEFAPESDLTWTDTDPDRFTLWDHQLAPYKPHDGDTYFTDLHKMTPAPSGACIVDHPPHTRLIGRGTRLFHVFERRTSMVLDFADLPIGARVAVHRDSPFFYMERKYESHRPDDTSGTMRVGGAAAAVMRCTGQDGDVEQFCVVQHAAAFFDFAPTSSSIGPVISPTPPAATILAEIRRSLIDSAARWRGGVTHNPHATIFELGPKDAPHARGRYVPLLVRGHDGDDTSHNYEIKILATGRAFMQRVAQWNRANMQVAAQGRFTAAHEWGHAFGNPDHYVEMSRNVSLYKGGIVDRRRSPGCPYAFDKKGMMNRNVKPRAYDFWHLAMWMIDRGKPFAGEQEIAIRRGPYRYTTPATPRDRSRERWPVVSKLAQRVGRQGLCDVFAYAAGVDGFNGGDGLPGATVENPFDLVVVVRVKLALDLREARHQAYTAGLRLVEQVAAILDRNFNRRRRLVARGRYNGKAVRARVLFSPRLIVRTYPGGTSIPRAAYVRDIRLRPDTAAAYRTKVNGLISTHGIHCDIRAEKDPDRSGITGANASPRTATIDIDRLEDTVVEVFGSLLGLADPDSNDANSFAPLVNALAPTFVGTTLEFVA